jgi:prepilin-type N-terminal cleavage/methylation domain-containing protein
MIYFLKKLKSNKLNKGMTYVELIVVLSIFAMISSVVMFNYGDFQSKVDMKNLASDVALEIAEAQRASLSGVMPAGKTVDSMWKPSFGVRFSLLEKGGEKNFKYFVDLDNNSEYDGLDCDGRAECLKMIEMTKNNFISSIEFFYEGSSTPTLVEDVTITFLRPSSGAVFKTSDPKIDYGAVSYFKITIDSGKKISSAIKVYASGRIQVE